MSETPERRHWHDAGSTSWHAPPRATRRRHIDDNAPADRPCAVRRPGDRDLLIGHIHFTTGDSTADGRFVSLVTALHRTGVRQHVLTGSAPVATTLRAIGDIAVGPPVTSPVIACCLMPQVDIAHAHDPGAGQVGLLLALTRSIPYLLTHRAGASRHDSALLKAVYRRARCVICEDDSAVALMRHWLPGLAVTIIPDTEPSRSAEACLALYQNSQRTPIAGNSGSQ